MANIKISELPQVTSLSNTDVFPSVSGVTTSKITLKNLADSLPIVSSSISASWAPGIVSPLSTTGSSIYSTDPATSQVNANNGIFIGALAGYQAPITPFSTFLGNRAGYQATIAQQSNFIGFSAGESAVGSNTANFFGYRAGYQAENGQGSNFIGYEAGFQAGQASVSNFFGAYSGYQAASASFSNFTGYESGYRAVSASYSTLIGYRVGYNQLGGASGIKSNNIIIGTNITLPNGTKDSMNLGGIIFATGSYSNTAGNPFSGSVDGKVGINKSNPQYALDVSGSFRVQDGITILTKVSMSLDFANDTAAAAGGVPLGGLYRSGSLISIRLV